MRVFLNATLTRGPYGGANSFLRTLTEALRARGAVVVHDLDAGFDVALVNGLTDGFGLAEVSRIHARGIPIVHRKVGYRERGSAELRREVDGVVTGDRLQIEFEPHLFATVFQSRYSYDGFRASGWEGSRFEIIPNGVDPAIFSLWQPPRFFWQSPVRRSFWAPGQIFKFAISTWSADESKGFRLFREIDRALKGRRDISVSFAGRTPAGTTFRNIRVSPPMRAPKLASFLRRHHGYLAFSEHDTCSNALLEAISCGLQVIYLDSGSHREFAADVGVAFEGDFDVAVDKLRQGYAERLARWDHPLFDINPVADRYLALLRQALEAPPQAKTDLASA